MSQGGDEMPSKYGDDVVYKEVKFVLKKETV